MNLPSSLPLSGPLGLQLPPAPARAETGFLNLGQHPRADRSLAVNSRWLTLDGKHWMPVMGEFHYSRFPENEWRTELLKMAAGGVNIVASYVFWNHHEEQRGEFVWTGQRNLRRFVELVAEAGLLFYLRPGPWVHAEARYGGLPDWVMAQGPVRNNDAAYLAAVRAFYGQIGAQLRGLLWCDGGPVIGLQLENEYDQVGPGRGAEHIEALRHIAIDSGLTVPLYTVTGWPTLDIPEREVIPVSGAYADGFWSGATEPLPPSGVFLFDTSRAIGEMGNVGGTPAEGRIDPSHYPFFLAEAGGGMHVSYHRRPVVTLQDVAATALVQVGSGANLYGYYMYHGGCNPAALVPGARLQETQDTGYPNDVLVLNYDFRTPLGQYGQVRASYGRLRCLHQFMAAFGEELAAMEAVLPAERASGPEDRSRLRASLRGAGDNGFLFVNNHLRHHPLPAFSGVQFEVQHSGGTTLLPATPVQVPSGLSFIWPIGLRLGAARLAHATVQPLTRWTEPDDTQVLVAFALPEFGAKLHFEAASIEVTDSTPGDEIQQDAQGWQLDIAVTIAPRLLRVTDATGAVHSVVLLPQALADQCLHAKLNGRDRLLISPQPLYLDGDEAVVSVADDGLAQVQVWPANEVAAGFAVQMASLPARVPGEVALALLQDNPSPPPVRLGPHVAWRGKSTPLAPDDEAYAQATRWSLDLPAELAQGPGRVMLVLDYLGDAARLYADGELVDDHFYDGEPWQIGVDRFVVQGNAGPSQVALSPTGGGLGIAQPWGHSDGRWPVLELAVLAADPEAPIFLEAFARERLREVGGRPTLASVALHTRRELRLSL
ncbi:beta-galactosidase [Ideonella azotifigens]|uniref:Beta-galactosidase n=2 Tax=Ideonella azotifigens TaxID=513160 RepID=A0ABN1K6D0_9BURK|nr:beta-galactosidase [Ideonella azotifigens]MCD2342546.1 beta-galactosidase [Ideonella azotifigens]